MRSTSCFVAQIVLCCVPGAGWAQAQIRVTSARIGCLDIQKDHAELSQLSGTNLFKQEELPSFAPGNKFPLQQSLALSQRLRADLSCLLVCKIVSNCFLSGDRLIRFRLGISNALHLTRL
jgi:hypothetical protein